MKVLYVKCNSTRIKKFQLKTVIYEEDGEKFVKKEALCKEAIPHLMQMKENYNRLNQTIVDPRIHFAKIISETGKSLTFEYIDGVSMEELFLQTSKTDPDKSEKIIVDYISIVTHGFQTKSFEHYKMEENYQSIFGESEYQKLDGHLCFSGISNCDLIPSNILYKEDKIYIIDYEWIFDLSVPVEYVIFRGLNLFHEKDLLQKYVDVKIVDELSRAEDYFILQYILTKESFFQIQHDYLKNSIPVLEEFQMKDQELEIKNQELQMKNQELDMKNTEIHYLKEIAQSMRLKNRIKKLIPNKIFKYFKASTEGVEGKEK